MQLLSLDAVNMRKDEVHIFLSKAVKRCSFRTDVSEEGVVLFNTWLFRGSVWFAKEKYCFFFSEDHARFLIIYVQNDRRDLRMKFPKCLNKVILGWQDW